MSLSWDQPDVHRLESPISPIIRVSVIERRQVAFGDQRRGKGNERARRARSNITARSIAVGGWRLQGSEIRHRRFLNRRRRSTIPCVASLHMIAFHTRYCVRSSTSGPCTASVRTRPGGTAVHLESLDRAGACCFLIPMLLGTLASFAYQAGTDCLRRSCDAVVPSAQCTYSARRSWGCQSMPTHVLHPSPKPSQPTPVI